MNNLLAWFSPTRWAVLGVLLLTLSGFFFWYRGELIQNGRDEVRTQWAEAIEKAKEAQAAANTVATAAAVKTITLQKLVYVDRIKEVNKYVPAPNTVCPADDDFVRLYNAARPASGTGAK